MAVILGTVPGWERDSDWSSTNRTYRGPGYTKYVGQSISEKEAHYYRMLINITVYLYESKCSNCNVALTRKIDDIEIIGLFRNEYRGGLDRWINIFSNSEAEEILDRSRDEVGGLLDCSNCDRFDIDVVESEYRPPTPVELPEEARRYIESFFYPQIRREADDYDRMYEIAGDIQNVYRDYGVEPPNRDNIIREALR